MKALLNAVLILTAIYAYDRALSAQTVPPLPDRAEFLANVRASLFTDEAVQEQYTYRERREEIRVSKLGKVSVDRVRLFEVYASPDPLHRYRRLIADDGVPLGPDELGRRDADYAKYLADLRLEREHETAEQRSARLAREGAEIRKRNDLVDDVFRAFDMALVRRETSNGRPTIVVSLTPAKGVKTRTDTGKYFRKFRGTAWIDEADHQLARVELECLETILVGWGMLGRIHEGSRLTLERRKINDEAWLPYRFLTEIRGRALVFRRFNVAAETEYSDYRRFSVDTRETFEVPPR